jgi:glycosyltransferase involved in cell wall biosynthesis
MSECTLFALPSWYEGLGCVYLEAMSAGCAAMACYGQGMDELIRHGENGWLVQPKDVDDLANGLHVLLSDPALCDRIGRCGRETILQGLTWKHHAEHLQSIYQACVA